MAESKARAGAEQVASVGGGGVTGMILGLTVHSPELAATLPAAGSAAATLLKWFGFDKAQASVTRHDDRASPTAADTRGRRSR